MIAITINNAGQTTQLGLNLWQCEHYYSACDFLYLKLCEWPVGLAPVSPPWSLGKRISRDHQDMELGGRHSRHHQGMELVGQAFLGLNLQHFAGWACVLPLCNIPRLFFHFLKFEIGSLAKLPSMDSDSLCNPGSLWTCNPLNTFSLLQGITVLCH